VPPGPARPVEPGHDRFDFGGEFSETLMCRARDRGHGEAGGQGCNEAAAAVAQGHTGIAGDLVTPV
jgi:hypothetical protein